MDENMNSIPQNVIEALAEVRELGKYNMFDQRSVTHMAAYFDLEAGEWLVENKHRYMDALNAMGEYISKPKPTPTPPTTGSAMLKDFEDAPTAKPTTESSIALLKDFDEEPTPAANTETVSAKAVKLSAAQDDGMRKIAKAHTRVGGEQWIDPYIIDVRQATAEALGKKGLVETSYTGVVGYKQFVRVRFTELGKQYAIAHGWLTAPANSEPQADITPADIAAVEAMGEVAANVFGEDVCDEALKCEHGINVVHCTDCYVKSERSDDELDELMREYDRKIAREEMQSLYNSDSGVDADDYRAHIDANVLDVPASDEISKQDAQPEGVLTDKQSEALEDIVSVAKSYVEMKGTIRRSWVGKIPRKRLIELDDLGMIDFYVDRAQQTLELTPTGIAYAKSRGWLTDAGRAAIAQTAPVDGGSDGNVDDDMPFEKPTLLFASQSEMNNIDKALGEFSDLADTPNRKQIAKWAHQSLEKLARNLDHYTLEEVNASHATIERQQAEIRALESKLAAAKPSIATDDIQSLATDITRAFDWRCKPIFQLVMAMLEDVNMHDETRALAKFEKEYDED